VPAYSIVLLPEHIEVGPVMVGVGFELTVTATDVDPVQPPRETVTEYVPAVEGEIDCVVVPVDHK
jgi:hypothetical protein